METANRIGTGRRGRFDVGRGRARGSALSRRALLKGALAAGGAMALPLGSARCGSSASGGSGSGGPDQPLIYVSLDAFYPRYLALDANGDRGGRPGNWLAPNVHAFLDEATHFSDARCYLPAATDMNHLNAVAGTSSAQHGILGVSLQLYGWKPDGQPDGRSPHMTWAVDDLGRPTDTLFRAWKRKWPSSRTAYVSGKFWVADMYRYEGSGLDVIVTSPDRPSYVPESQPWSFYDPLTVFNGGHGAPDTQRILQAIGGPGIAKGRVIPDPGFERNDRVADLAVTVANRYGLDLETTTVGQDRSSDLGKT